MERGILWVDNIPETDVVLHISVERYSDEVTVSEFGLSVEMPAPFASFIVNER